MIVFSTQILDFETVLWWIYWQNNFMIMSSEKLTLWLPAADAIKLCTVESTVIIGNVLHQQYSFTTTDCPMLVEYCL